VNKFLTSINNELPEARNRTYAFNLATLRQLVLVVFSEDKTVIPKETAWFGSEIPQDLQLGSGNSQIPIGVTNSVPDRVVVPMRFQRIYLEDWIGLRRLDQRRAIRFETCDGEHMQLGNCWEDIVRKYVGGPMLVM